MVWIQSRSSVKQLLISRKRIIFRACRKFAERTRWHATWTRWWIIFRTITIFTRKPGICRPSKFLLSKYKLFREKEKRSTYNSDRTYHRLKLRITFYKFSISGYQSQGLEFRSWSEQFKDTGFFFFCYWFPDSGSR